MREFAEWLLTVSGAYCKKAYRDILSTVFPNSTHVLCLACSGKTLPCPARPDMLQLYGVQETHRHSEASC